MSYIQTAILFSKLVTTDCCPAPAQRLVRLHLVFVRLVAAAHVSLAGGFWLSPQLPRPPRQSQVTKETSQQKCPSPSGHLHLQFIHESLGLFAYSKGICLLFVPQGFLCLCLSGERFTAPVNNTAPFSAATQQKHQEHICSSRNISAM